MSKLLEKIKSTFDYTIPDKEELTHGLHPRIEYLLLVLRNIFVFGATLFFLVEFLLHGDHATLKAIAYFCGAIAYLFECLAVTDCFRTRVPHTEMFMVYCFGPLYVLMGLNYIFY